MTATGAAIPRHRTLVPHLPRSAWVVLSGDFVSAVGSGLTLPCLIVYLHRVRGLSLPTAGLALATIALASLFGNPIGGAAADHWKPRQTLIAGLVVAAAGSTALAVVHGTVALFEATALIGLGVSVIWPAQDALLASMVDPASRSAAFSVRHAIQNAGFAVGALVAAAILSVAHPNTFVAVYLIDAVSFLAFIPVLARLADPADTDPTDADPTLADPTHAALGDTGLASAREPGGEQHRPQPAITYRTILQDRRFLRVWALTALIVGVSYGQFQSSFAEYATRPGGINPRGLALAFAANAVTVVVAQLFVLRRLNGHRRTTGAALAALAWAATWGIVLVGGHLGRGTAAEIAFVVAMIVFALGETLLSPTLPAIINDLAPAEARGRYNGLGTLAYTAGFVVGPSGAGAALGAGWGSHFFALLVIACGLAAAAALRLSHHLPANANFVADPDARPDQ